MLHYYYIMSAHYSLTRFSCTIHIGTHIASYCITLSRGHVVCWHGSMGSQISHVGLATSTTTRHHSIQRILHVSSRLETWLCQLPTHGTASFGLVLRFYSWHANGKGKLATNTSIQTITIVVWSRDGSMNACRHELLQRNEWYASSSPLTPHIQCPLSSKRLLHWE